MEPGATELVFQVSGPHPLLDLTRRHPGSAVLLNARPGTAGEAPADGATTLALVGGPEAQADLERLLADGGTALAPAHKGPRSAAYVVNSEHPIRVRYPLDGIIMPLQEALKADFIHDPLLIRGGWLTVRVFTLRGIHPRAAVDELQTASRRLGLDFRLVTLAASDLASPAVPLDGLTDKQLKTVKAAKALGFYDTPKRANLDTLAQIFGVSKAAVHSRLKAAERKIISEYTDRM